MISKLIAGRIKDRAFCQRAIELEMVTEEVLLERLERTYDVEQVVIGVARHQVREYCENLRQAQNLLTLDDDVKD